MSDRMTPKDVESLFSRAGSVSGRMSADSLTRANSD